MSFDSISIRDSEGDPRLVAGRQFAQGSDDLFHQSALALGVRIEEASGVSFTGTATEILLDGSESHVLIDIDPTLSSGIEVAVEYIEGRLTPADIIPLTPGPWRTGSAFFPVTQFGGLGVIRLNPSNGYTRYAPGPATPDCGNRIILIPTRGASKVLVRSPSGSGDDNGWARMALAPSTLVGVNPEPPVRRNRVYLTPSSGEASYSTGDVVCATIDATVVEAPNARFSQAVLEAITVGDYADELGDFDIVVGGAGGAFAGDGDPFDPAGTNYFGAILAILECRASPTVGQYKIHAAPSGPFVAISSLNISLPWPDFNDGPPPEFIPCTFDIVTRGALSAAPDLEIEATFNFDV